MDTNPATMEREDDLVLENIDLGQCGEIKELVIANPLLYDNPNVYIWIDDTHKGHGAAQRLFDWLLRKKIYVKGFATNVEALLHLKMYNKEIYDISTLDKELSSVFCDLYFECMDMNISCEVHSARVINPDIVEKWQELDKDIRKRYEKRFFYNLEMGRTGEGIVYNDGIKKERLFCLESFWMFNHFVGKRVYIYGFGAVEKEFAEYLKLLDYDFVGFLVDEMDSMGEQQGNLIQYVEEILLEENFYIWVYDKKKAKKLNEFGLKYFKNYYVKDYRFDVTINQKTILDINLGNNYLAGSKYPGVMIYGDEKEDDFKIAVLGGSTTDGTMYPFKSWPQLLYEELGRGGDNITIYNGGVCSYTSGQELIKLVRDILQLKPDMIIVYDGYNNLAFNSYPQYPFAFLYLEKVFEYAKIHMDDEDDIAYMDEKGVSVCMGIESGQGRFDNWMSDIRAMHAIAAENNISFFSFCQPTLYSKKRNTLREKNMLLSMHNAVISIFRKESFRKHMEQVKELPDYMYDLSHIFDEEDDVYIDVCHVWEKGNSIIAREIKKIIFSKVAAGKNNNGIGQKL